MISSFLCLAEAEVASDNAITKLTRDFGVSVPGVLAQMLSFCVVAFVLWRFAFKPVLATLDERKEKIDAGLKYAEEMKVKLAASEQAWQARIQEASVKGNQIVAEAQKAAKELTERQQAEAAAKAGATVAKALEAIELEKKKMLAEARSEIARLVVATTQRVLAKDLSDADRTRFNESAARELSQV